MSWLETALNLLDAGAPWGYRPLAQPCTEPTALCAMALGAHGRSSNHQMALGWLAKLQTAGGSVGVSATHPQPRWPTSLAVLAWQVGRFAKPSYQAARTSGVCGRECDLGTAIDRAVQWILTSKGKCSPRSADLGHDRSLLGWPWVLGTHSWVEPTAMHLLALKATGFGMHVRSRSGAAFDRPVVGRRWLQLREHQRAGPGIGAARSAHGIVLLALIGEEDTTGRI